MYGPRLSSEARPAVLMAAIREIGIATFVTPTPAGIEATLVPIVARQAANGGLMLAAHVARANPHWRAAQESASLAIFQGPHAYMSPEWYPTKGETGKVVPTWLYISIHAHGRLTAGAVRVSDGDRHELRRLSSPTARRRPRHPQLAAPGGQ